MEGTESGGGPDMGRGSIRKGVPAGFPFLPGRYPEWSRVARSAECD